MKMPPPSPPSAPFRSFPISKQLNLLCTFGRCRPVSPLQVPVCASEDRLPISVTLFHCVGRAAEAAEVQTERKAGRVHWPISGAQRPGVLLLSSLSSLSLLSPLPHYYCPKLLHSSGSVGARLNKKRGGKGKPRILCSQDKDRLSFSQERECPFRQGKVLHRLYIAILCCHCTALSSMLHNVICHSRESC